jgi:hypothetical protein
MRQIFCDMGSTSIEHRVDLVLPQSPMKLKIKPLPLLNKIIPESIAAYAYRICGYLLLIFQFIEKFYIYISFHVLFTFELHR